MKKPKKSAAPLKAPPKTDAEALSDIIEWSKVKNRPAWQRQALKMLVQNPVLTADQLTSLYQLAVDGNTASDPIEEADVRSPMSASAVVNLKAVKNPQDVNALASDQSLSFDQSGLTIVYGDNGAGKSGYARILKQACRARLEPRPAPILPNIYEQNAGEPRARIAYSVNGQNRQIDWQSGMVSPAELSAVSVFDARTAVVHVDGTNDVAYTPYALELMQHLARTAEALREQCKREQTEIANETPEALRAPPIAAETAVYKALAAINAEVDLKIYEDLAALSEQEKADLTSLRQDLSGDPAKSAQRMMDSSEGLLRFSETIRRLCEAASSKTLAELRKLKADKDATREAADAAARTSFADEPLPEVGSEAWRTLWEAARKYAAIAQPDRPFPPPDGPCPLCQQDLSAEAADRLSRFEAFVRDDTKTRADAAEKAYSERVAALNAVLLPASQIRRQLCFIRVSLLDEKAADAARIVVSGTWQLRRIVRSHTDAQLNVTDLDASAAIAELQRLANQLKERAAALSAAADSPERKALMDRLKELEARSWLGGMLPDVAKEIERKKRLKTLSRVEAETDTRAITHKASQLAEALVTDALRAQFAKEVAALGVSDLAIELKKESSQAGAARFRVRLTRKPTAVVGAVLSEGEHRCVALAAFLAELATSGSKSAIIFDDPVSSLDHRHREEVAARLAAEAQHRQVIVLTHDIAFLMLLHKAAQEQQVHVGFRCVSKGSDRAGYCNDELPFNARPVESVLDAIEADINNKRILHERGRQAEWRNAVRGALEQLRETWERAVEEFIGPVFKRLSVKVESRNLRKLTVLEIADCDAMREGYSTCSELLHSVGESLNPRLPTPDEIIAEITKLRAWHTDLRTRQSRVKAA